MDFDALFNRLKNRIWSPISDEEIVDMIIKAYMSKNINDEEKELLLDMV